MITKEQVEKDKELYEASEKAREAGFLLNKLEIQLPRELLIIQHNWHQRQQEVQETLAKLLPKAAVKLFETYSNFNLSYYPWVRKENCQHFSIVSGWSNIDLIYFFETKELKVDNTFAPKIDDSSGKNYAEINHQLREALKHMFLK